MKIEKITFGKTIARPGYNNDKPEVEVILEPGETLEQVLSALNKRLTDWHKAEYPHLYQEHESMRGVQETYPQPFPDPKRHGHMTSGQLSPQQVTYGPTPEINIQHERIQIGIENAATVEELKAVKVDHPLMPASLMLAYNSKMEELTK